MVPAEHRPCPGRGQERGESVDETSHRRGWQGSLEETLLPWRASALERRSACQATQTAAEKGAVAHGFRGEVWTWQRVAQVIKREFGVLYHPAHVSRILKRLGFSLQKPSLADQRDEDAIEEWKEKRWPKLKKGLSRRAGR